MIRSVFRVLLLGIILIIGVSRGENLEVFYDGTPRIYLDAANASAVPLAKTASTMDDLKRCFQGMTGVVLPEAEQPGLVPLRLLLLPPEDPLQNDAFGLQGYEISVQTNGIILSAPTALGVVNAVMHLLDGWGCRWVMPSELGEVIPARETLSLPLGTKRHWIGSDTRINSFTLKGVGENELQAWGRRNRMATERWISGQHYYSYAIPPNQYFEDHPEYYALIGGERRPTQLCTTNPDVIALTIAVAKTRFKNNPSADSFPLDPNDNSDFCQCANCVALDPPGTIPDGQPLMTDRVIAFANEVARGIRADYPDKVVALYAYSTHTLPPVTVMPESNLAIYVCRFQHCLLHLAPSSRCASPRAFLDMVEAWKALVPNLYLYEYFPIYWTGNLPCPNYLDFAASVKQTRQLGVLGSHEDNSLSFGNNTYINDYMATRMKVCPGLDPDDVLTDLCHSFFGPASEPMQAYYLALAGALEYRHLGRNSIVGSLRKYDEMFTPEIVASAREALTLALTMAPAGTMERRRVEMVDVGQRYLEAYLEGIAKAKAGQYEASVAAFDRAEALIDQMNPNAYGGADAADCRRRIRQSRLRFHAEYFPEQMGMVRRWKLLGPFNNDTRDADVASDGYDPAQGAEGPVRFSDGQVLAWTPYTSPNGVLDLKAAFAPRKGDWHCTYGYAAFTVKAPAARAVQLRMDSFFPFRVWLNGQEVFYRAGCNSDAPDNNIRNANLKAGDNTLVFKCAQTANDINFPWFLYMRITDQQGNPMRDLQEASVATIAYWRFEPGAFTNDSSGNGHTLMNMGANSSTDVPDGAPDGPNGASVGSAYFYNPSNAYLKTVAALNLSSYKELTIEWYMKNQGSGTQYAWGHGEAAGSMRTYLNANIGGGMGKIEPWQDLTGGGYVYSAGSLPGGIAGNQWHHYAFQIACTNLTTTGIRLFIDGVEQGTFHSVVPLTPTAFLDSVFHIGVRSALYGYMTGWIDELRITSGFLAPEEFLNSQGKTIAYWRFEPGSLTTDSSGNGYTLTNMGAMASTDVPARLKCGSTGSVRFARDSNSCMRTVGTLNLTTCPQVTIEWFMKNTGGSSQYAWEHGISAGGLRVYLNANLGNGLGMVAPLQDLTGGGYVYREEPLIGGISGNQWHHYAFQIDCTDPSETGLKFFVDGKETGTFRSYQTPTPTAFLNKVFFIGARAPQQPFGYMNGSIDELRISAGLLSPNKFLNAHSDTVFLIR